MNVGGLFVYYETERARTFTNFMVHFNREKLMGDKPDEKVVC